MRFTRTVKSILIAAPVLGVTGFGVLTYSPKERVAEAGTITVNSTLGDEVQRVELVNCDVTQGWPVMVVRDIRSKGPWWIQSKCEPEGSNRYKARVHFGNDKTSPGTKYQMVVLSVADSAAAAKFEVGKTMEDLPIHLPHSDPIEVVRK